MSRPGAADHQDDLPRVLIIGGGFAGLFAARALRRTPAAVTLVDRNTHHLFQPLLYQCATGTLSEGQIAAPLRDVLKRQRNLDCVLAKVTDIDTSAHEVGGLRPGGERVVFRYDYLIVAAGMQQSYFGHDEYAPWAPGMKTLSDALSIRQRVFGAFERAETMTDPDARSKALTFALVGAGPTGVELAGQLRELATHTLRSEFRHLEPEHARVLLFDGGTAALAAFGPALSQKATKVLTDLGVELHLESRVVGIDADGLTVADSSGTKTRYPADTVLWTAGVEAPEIAEAFAKATDAPRDRAGRIEVQPDLTLPGHPEIAVVGDLMSLNKLPGLAEVAMQSGFFAGRRIHRAIAGKQSDKPFRYHDLGSAAYISRGHAVVSAGPIRCDGLLGWLIWGLIHIAFLTGYRNRAGALLSWLPNVARGRRRERAFLMQKIDTSHDLYAAPSAEQSGKAEHSVT
jgi:NADH dehydrogenase